MSKPRKSFVYGKSKVYNSHNKDAKAKKFYNSKEWKLTRKKVIIRDNGFCQICLKRDPDLYRLGNYVHHILSLADNPELALEMSNLILLCADCHNEMHPEKGGGATIYNKKKKQKHLKYIEPEHRKELF